MPEHENDAEPKGTRRAQGTEAYCCLAGDWGTGLVVQVLSSPLPTLIHPLQFNAIGMDRCRDGMDGTTSRLFVARGEGGRRSAGGPGGNDDDRRWQPSRAAQHSAAVVRRRGRVQAQRQRSRGDIASHHRLRPARCGRSCGGGGRALNAKNAWAACGPPAARGVAHEACACCLCLRAGRPHTSHRSRSRPRAGPPQLLDQVRLPSAS